MPMVRPVERRTIFGLVLRWIFHEPGRLWNSVGEMVKTLSAKYSVFTVVLVLWVVLVLLLFDMKQEVPGSTRGIVAGLVLVVVSGLVSRFTVRIIARPLANLQGGLNAVRGGRLEKIRVSRTGD